MLVLDFQLIHNYCEGCQTQVGLWDSTLSLLFPSAYIHWLVVLVCAYFLSLSCEDNSYSSCYDKDNLLFQSDLLLWRNQDFPNIGLCLQFQNLGNWDKRIGICIQSVLHRAKGTPELYCKTLLNSAKKRRLFRIQCWRATLKNINAGSYI